MAAAAAAAISAPPALLRVLSDLSAKPRPSGPEAHAAALLRGRVLSRLSAALSAEGLDALLVKGAALALTVYPPAARPMSDIDLLVRPGARAQTIAALARKGFAEHPPKARPMSGELLGESLLTLVSGSISSVVEVHTTLDKIVPRPVDERGLFERARPAPDLPALFIPSPEDHVLLIALHAAGHEFHHPVAFLDIELLLRGGLNIEILARRARAWRLGSVMFIAMATLRALGAASVTDAHVSAFDPGPLRRAAIARFYSIGSYPVARSPLRLGLPWILRQTPLRDDLGAWLRGVAHYALLRAADRLVAPPGASGD
jgi:hypothetical protein